MGTPKYHCHPARADSTQVVGESLTELSVLGTLSNTVELGG